MEEKIKENNNQNNQYKINLKFLHLIKIKPSDNAFKFLSLKKASVLLTLICFLISFFQIIFDYKYIKYSCIVCPFFNICLCGSLNLTSFIYFLKSYKTNDYLNAYKGNLAIMSSFIVHFFLFIIDIIFSLSFSPIDLFFIFESRFLSFVLPNIIFLFYEFYVTWVCYSYTYHLLEGHDILVNGENNSNNIIKNNDNQNIQLSEINASS